MGRVAPGGKKGPKPKTLIQQKREERKLKKRLPQPPQPKTAPKPYDPAVEKTKRPKPKPQNPGFQKWMSLFKREITVIETHLKHCEQYRMHWRAEIDKMADPEEKEKWESGEVGNFVRLLDMMERTREILVQARQVNAWIVPAKHLGLNKNLPGMKEFVLGAEKKAEATNGDKGEGDESDSMDTDEEQGSAAPADFIPLVARKKRKTTVDSTEKDKSTTAIEPVTPNAFFVVDTEPTPVDVDAIKENAKKSRKRAKSDALEERKAAKKAKLEEKRASIVVPQPEPEPEPESASTPEPKPEPAKVDFSAIEAQLASEIEAATKTKEERKKAKAEKLAKKEKKRKRLSAGDSEKEVKKAKKEGKEKKRKAGGSGDDEVRSDEGGKKKRKAAI